MPIRGFHTGDAHIDSDVHGTLNPDTGISRAWESHARALRSLVERAVEEDVDFFLHAGDAFKHGRPSQEAVLLFAETMAPLGKAGIPLILLDGNHERLMVPTSQRTATAVVGNILSQHGEVHVVEREPALVRTSSGLQIACLPWLSKTTILARLGESGLDPAEGDQKVVDFALRAMDAMVAEADTSAPLILASHVTLDDVRLDSVAKGCRRGSEVDIAHIFAEPILPRKAVEALPFSYAALSHIHARQRMGKVCFYAGCPDRLTMTDADDPKSGNLITIGDDNTLEGFEQVPTDARAMHLIDLTDPASEGRLETLEAGALVGLVLEPGDPAAPEQVRKMIADAGATVVSVKTTPKERSRSAAPVLAEKSDPLTALKAWLKAKEPEGVDDTYAVALAAKMLEDAK